MFTRKMILVGMLLAFLSSGTSVLAENFLGSGTINANSGIPDKDLSYEDFKITEDGYATGYIVNSSSRARPGVRLDMWTTNMAETRIFWRKSLNIGDIPPNGKVLVKEPYDVKGEDPARTKFMFRLPSGANYRNN
jgi:hypothetical protein